MTEPLSYDILGVLAESIVEDYEYNRQPFNEENWITRQITRNISEERDKAIFLTLTTVLNRQRDAEALYQKCQRLWYDEHWIFEPNTLVKHRDFEELYSLFKSEGMRYGESDAQAWYEINRTLHQYYDSDPTQILELFNHNWEKVENHIEYATGDPRFFKHNKRFPILRGDKIRPLWLRLINNQVVPLEHTGSTSIPVDTHIRQITERLCGTSLSTSEKDKEKIRGFWQKVCSSSKVTADEIDGPLWYINRGWDEWGESYFQSLLEENDAKLGEFEIENL